MNGNESSGLLPTMQQVESENGKTWYYLNTEPPPEGWKLPESNGNGHNEQELKFENPHENYGFDDQNNTRNGNKRGGKQDQSMVVNNSKEMFQNVNVLPDGRYFCSLCNRPYKTNATLMAHLRGTHLRHETRCNEPGCTFVAQTMYQKRTHLKSHERLKQNEMTKMQKKAMRQSFPIPSEEELLSEILRSNKDIEGMVKSLEPKTGKVRYTCQECTQVFHNTFHAQRHMEYHSQLPKQCFYCGDVRRGVLDLRMHYLRAHKEEGIRTFTCNECKTGFTSHQLFLKHLGDGPTDCTEPLPRQGIYYGELPDTYVIEPAHKHRLELFRKKHLDWMAATNQVVELERGTYNCQNRENYMSDRAMPKGWIQTVCGLKSYQEAAEIKPAPTSPYFRQRSMRKCWDNTEEKQKAIGRYLDYETQQNPAMTYYPDNNNNPSNDSSAYLNTQRLPTASSGDNMMPQQPQSSYQNMDYDMGYQMNYHREVREPYANQNGMISGINNSSYDDSKKLVYDGHKSHRNDNRNFIMRNDETFGVDLLSSNGHNDPVFEELNGLDYVLPTNSSDKTDDLMDIFQL